MTTSGVGRQGQESEGTRAQLEVQSQPLIGCGKRFACFSQGNPKTMWGLFLRHIKGVLRRALPA
jgi:hypothetical protein